MLIGVMKSNMRKNPNYYVSEETKINGQHLLTLYEGMLPQWHDEHYHDLLQEVVDEYIHEESQSSGQVHGMS